MFKTVHIMGLALSPSKSTLVCPCRKAVNTWPFSTWFLPSINEVVIRETKSGSSLSRAHAYNSRFSLLIEQVLMGDYNILLMDLNILKDYFSFLAKAQLHLQTAREALDLDRHNCYAFYKLIATKCQSHLDQTLITAFIKTFTYSFQPKEPHQLVNDSNYQLLPHDDKPTQDQLIARGTTLFLNKWGVNGQLRFQEFCQFLKEDGEIPDKSKELEYHLKKKFYQMLEDEIQNLLDADTFRKTVAMQYKNLVDLFELLSADEVISIQEIKNLYLMSGERKNELFFELIAKRFPLPCDYDTFKQWFSIAPNPSKYKQQTKIYYSSLKKKKNGPYYDQESEEKFMTPNGKSAAAAGVSSTKMTKADRLHSIKRSKIQVSRFTFDECPQSSARKSTVILADILSEQQRINELKRQLIYQQDYDLELIYERRGREFEQLLNKRYGSCNFTSFVRYLVPQDFEHRYLAFIKYQKESCLSEDTNDKISYLLEQEETKESAIKQWWADLDRELVFRGYCRPGDKNIPNQELKKYFTERQCKVLLDRLDPNRTGAISYDNFY